MSQLYVPYVVKQLTPKFRLSGTAILVIILAIIGGSIWGVFAYEDYKIFHNINNVIKRNDTRLFEEKLASREIQWAEIDEATPALSLKHHNRRIMCPLIHHFHDRALQISYGYLEYLKNTSSDAVRCFLSHPGFTDKYNEFYGFDRLLRELEDKDYEDIKLALELGFNINDWRRTIIESPEPNMVAIPVKVYQAIKQDSRSYKNQHIESYTTVEYKHVPIPGDAVLSDFITEAKVAAFKTKFGGTYSYNSHGQRNKFKPLEQAILLNKRNYIRLFMEYGAHADLETKGLKEALGTLGMPEVIEALILINFEPELIKEHIIKSDLYQLKRLGLMSVKQDFESENDLIDYVAQYGSPDVLAWVLNEVGFDKDNALTALEATYEAISHSNLEWLISNYDFSKVVFTLEEYDERRGVQHSVLSDAMSGMAGIDKSATYSILRLLRNQAFADRRYSKLLVLDAWLNQWGYVQHLTLSGDDDALKEYLTRSPEMVNTRDINGNTPLILAAKYGRMDTIKTLLQMKANIDAEDHSGMTALTHAAYDGSYKLVEMLVQKGASLRATNREDACSAPLTAVSLKIETLGIFADMIGRFSRIGLSVNGLHVPDLIETKHYLTRASNEQGLDVCRAE